MFPRCSLLASSSLLFGLIFFLFYNSSSAQDALETEPLFTQQQFITGCAKYRERVLHDLEDEMISFGMLADSLAMTSANPAVHQQLMVEFLKGMLPENREMDPAKAIKTAKELLQKDAVSMLLYKEWFDQHGFAISELGFLVAIGLLEEKPPYKLANLKLLWEEFSFYQLKQGMTVADVGAGNGFLSFILLESGLQMDLILTEIDKDFLELLTTKIKVYQAVYPKSSLSLIQGYESSLGLKDRKVDCMIFREVFHHMNDVESILSDVQNHLKPGGTIILSEATKDFDRPKSELCNQATTYDKIMKSMKKAGFHLVEETIVNDSYMLRFKHGT